MKLERINGDCQFTVKVPRKESPAPAQEVKPGGAGGVTGQGLVETDLLYKRPPCP